MDEEVPGDRQVGGHQQRRPVDRMELENVLADQLVIGGPEAFAQVCTGLGVGQCCVVVEQRVPPDVDRLVLVPRNRDPPVDSAARERYVLQPAGEE